MRMPSVFASAASSSPDHTFGQALSASEAVGLTSPVRIGHPGASSSSSSAASFPNAQFSHGAVGATLAAQLARGQLPVLVHAQDLGLRKGPYLNTPSDWPGFKDWCYQVIEASGLKTASKTMKGLTTRAEEARIVLARAAIAFFHGCGQFDRAHAWLEKLQAQSIRSH